MDEKLSLLQGDTIFKTLAIPDKDIPSLYMLDGGTGMCFRQTTLEAFHNIREDGKKGLDGLGGLEGYAKRENIIQDVAFGRPFENYSKEERNAAEKVKAEIEKLVPDMKLSGSFPSGILLGATWDRQNIRHTGSALGKEAQYYGIDILLGTPNVNIHRDPLNGRLFEGYSEDPCLTAELAPGLVEGVQSEGVMADVKHFAANNQETNRREIDEIISERALREIYLPGFKSCVDAGVRTVMSAYNYINGVPCAQNRWLLRDVLKGEWGFQGAVISDWGAVYDQAEALNAGNDLEMPNSGKGIGALQAAIADGRLSEAVVDEALERFLRLIPDSIAVKGRKYTSLDRDGSRRAAYASAAEGMVLLKNNGILPLKQSTPVCCFGEKAKHFADTGSGSSNVVTDQTSSLLDSLREQLGNDRVSFNTIRDDTRVLVVVGGAMGSEGFDRKSMDLDPEDKTLVMEAVKIAKENNLQLILILNVCGPVDMRDYLDDVDAVLCVFYPGMEGGHVAADILTGLVNPSGKLPITFPKRYEDCPSSIYFPGRNLKTLYGEDIFVGYRWYDYRQIEPLFPFGFGLSYTRFAITDALLDRNDFLYDEESGFQLKVTLANAGERAGKEVVQIYLGQVRSTLVKPVKELKAFQKVYLDPGESRELLFVIKKEMLQSYDEELGEWTIEPGEYRIYIGTSSRDIAKVISFQAFGRNSFGFTEKTKLDILVKQPEAFAAFQRACRPVELTANQIAQMVLFQKAPSILSFWENSVIPVIGAREAEKRFTQTLALLNRYSI